MKWRVWKVDSTNLYLISDKPTSEDGYDNDGALWLEGVQGYNNGVKLLNDICSSCYSNKADYPGMKARSLNISDIEEVTTYDYTKYEGYGKNDITYSYYEIFNEEGEFEWPAQWYNHDKLDTDAPFSSRNEQDAFIEQGSATVLSPSEAPYQSLWEHEYGLSGTEFKNDKYYDLLFFEDDTTWRFFQLAGFPLRRT